MKREGRLLELLVTDGLVIGGVLRGKYLEHLFIEDYTPDIISKIEEKSFIKEVRKVKAKLESSLDNKKVLKVLEVLKAEYADELEYGDFYISLAKEMKKLLGGIVE